MVKAEKEGERGGGWELSLGESQLLIRGRSEGGGR